MGAVTRTVVDVAEIDAGGNRTLRLMPTRDGSGEPMQLTFAWGYRRGVEWLPDATPLHVPGRALPELRAALDALAGERGTP